MNVIRRRGWELPESQVTPEHLFLNRRSLLLGAAAGGIGALSLGQASAQRLADVATLPDPTADLYPAKANTTYPVDRPLTEEKVATTYNNFYEFGGDKAIASRAQALKIRPWTVKIDGMVEKPMEIGIDDLIRKMPLEERVYRLRCVEAWSMTIPWTGFPLAKLVALAKPLSSAKYRADGDLQGSVDGAGPASDLVSVALYRGPHHRRGRTTIWPSSSPVSTASRRRVRWARRSVSRCRGNTASSR